MQSTYCYLQLALHRQPKDYCPKSNWSTEYSLSCSHLVWKEKMSHLYKPFEHDRRTEKYEIELPFFSYEAFQASIPFSIRWDIYRAACRNYLSIAFPNLKSTLCCKLAFSTYCFATAWHSGFASKEIKEPVDLKAEAIANAEYPVNVPISSTFWIFKRPTSVCSNLAWTSLTIMCAFPNSRVVFCASSERTGCTDNGLLISVQYFSSGSRSLLLALLTVFSTRMDEWYRLVTRLTAQIACHDLIHRQSIR